MLLGAGTARYDICMLAHPVGGRSTGMCGGDVTCLPEGLWSCEITRVLVPCVQTLKPHYAKAATALKATSPDCIIAKVIGGGARSR